MKITGDATRYDHRQGNDDYGQASDLFRLMNAGERRRLIENIVASMTGIDQQIQIRQLVQFFRADPGYGAGVAKGLGIALEQVRAANSMPDTAAQH